jgi:hypothetical protein
MIGACVLIGNVLLYVEDDYVNIRDVSAGLTRFDVLKRSIFHSGAETEEFCVFLIKKDWGLVRNEWKC